MRVHLRHEIIFRYKPPVRSIIKLVRLVPRNFEGLHIADWRIVVEADCRLRTGEDAFGNITHSFDARGEFSHLRLRVESEIETFDTSGILKGAAERFPPELYLRDTVLTSASADLRNYALETTKKSESTLIKLHDFLAAIRADFDWSKEEQIQSLTAADVFSRGSGNAEGLAHVFIAGARHLEIPARFVSGYYLANETGLAHSWAEAHVERLGWVGFDPAIGACPSEMHMRLACGLDSLGAAPIRGSYASPGSEKVEAQIQLELI
jgi:transglutaminase-like putative cysteine protease